MKSLFKIIIMICLVLPIIYCTGTPDKDTIDESGYLDLDSVEEESSPSELESEDAVGEKENPAPSTETVKDALAETSVEPEDSKTRAGEVGGVDETLSFAEEDSSDTEKPSAPRTVSESGYSGSGASESGLKAGFADDNKQYGYFTNFLEEYNYALHLPLPVKERIILSVKDINDKSVNNAEVKLYNGNDLLSSGKTLADGTYQFNPDEFSSSFNSYKAEVDNPDSQTKKTVIIQRDGNRSIDIIFDTPRIIKNNIPLDILFILDTTGSMGEEINRLKTTIELIHLNLTSLNTKPIVRFGLVLYKDVEDEYLTRIVPLTENLNQFQEELMKVEAGGGGDTPEDLQAALDDSLNKIEWNNNGIRLAFIITDAPPHLDYNQAFTYTDAAKKAREEGIKIFSVGTGGLDIDGEYILRQISQYTSGKYIFLTYGESGESGGGEPGSVSHHTGSNFQTDKLEAIIIRFTKEELSFLSDKPIEDEDPYFQAVKLDSEKREDTLASLFNMALTELKDYSTYTITNGTTAAIIPVDDPSEKYLLDAEYFTERFILSAAEDSVFKLVERKDFQKILEELNLQLSGLTEETNVAEVGNLLNAKVLIAGKLYRTETEYELFIKLLRVETGEVLSVTKAKIDARLGLMTAD